MKTVLKRFPLAAISIFLSDEMRKPNRIPPTATSWNIPRKPEPNTETPTRQKSNGQQGSKTARLNKGDPPQGSRPRLQHSPRAAHGMHSLHARPASAEGLARAFRRRAAQNKKGQQIGSTNDLQARCTCRHAMRQHPSKYRGARRVNCAP